MCTQTARYTTTSSEPQCKLWCCIPTCLCIARVEVSHGAHDLSGHMSLPCIRAVLRQAKVCELAGVILETGKHRKETAHTSRLRGCLASVADIAMLGLKQACSRKKTESATGSCFFSASTGAQPALSPLPHRHFGTKPQVESPSLRPASLTPHPEGCWAP